MRVLLLGLLLASALRGTAAPAVSEGLPGAQPLAWEGDLSARMTAGIGRYLDRRTAAAPVARASRWQRDFTSVAAYSASVDTNRARLRTVLGIVDSRVAPPMTEVVSEEDPAPAAASAAAYRVSAVRWRVFDGVNGEGLWLRPVQAPVAVVIAIPDAAHTPEMLAGLAPGIPAASQWARRLAEQGCEVLIPALVDRSDAYSGNPRLGRFTNQPHREWIYRQAFEMGRTLPGLEIQKILAAVDWIVDRQSRAREGGAGDRLRVGVAGQGEGGLIALHAAAVDPRLDAAVVSGYFDSRQGLAAEPIYRNLFGYLSEFGDAETASLIAPRRLVVEFSEPPRVSGPPAARSGRSGAAPGKIEAPEFESVDGEVERARKLTEDLPGGGGIEFVHGAEGMFAGPGSDKALVVFLEGLGVKLKEFAPASPTPAFRVVEARVAERQRRQVRELEGFVQQLLRDSERVRAVGTWDHLKGGDTPEWRAAAAAGRESLWRDVIGRLPDPSQAPDPRARPVLDRDTWTADEIVLDVFPDVFAWGWLMRPKDLKPGERRPVVVCQHGLEGLPADTVNEDRSSPAWAVYKGFAAQLVRRGFVVYAPHNPYRGGDAFRGIQRKANPLGLSLYSFILAQHQASLKWLASLPFVDPDRIGFYGLSYGGKTAMRAGPLLEAYRCVVCSGDFNDWVMKNVTVDSRYSYMFMGEYELPEWNLGHTFNYAEMAMLIAPRPFLVERGHDDSVAPDSWVAAEFAKVRRGYLKLGAPAAAEIEFFDGPHTIHGEASFRFLHRNLSWPEPK